MGSALSPWIEAGRAAVQSEPWRRRENIGPSRILPIPRQMRSRSQATTRAKDGSAELLRMKGMQSPRSTGPARIAECRRTVAVGATRWQRMSFHRRRRPAFRMDAVYRTDTNLPWPGLPFTGFSLWSRTRKNMPQPAAGGSLNFTTTNPPTRLCSRAVLPATRSSKIATL